MFCSFACIRFSFAIIFVMFSSAAIAECDIAQSSMGSYYNQIRTQDGQDTANLRILFYGRNNSSDASIKLKTVPELWRAAFEHTLQTNADQVKFVVFKGLLLTAEATQNAVDLAKTNPNLALKWGHKLERISLGDSGAIVLIPANAYANCLATPNLFYIVPKFSKNVDPRVAPQVLKIDNRSWERLISSVLKFNSGNRLVGSTIEEVLNPSSERSTSSSRNRALSLPFTVNIMSKFDFAARAGQVTAMPTSHDNFSYVRYVTSDPATREINKNSINTSKYFSEKHIVEGKIRDGTVTDEELEAELKIIQQHISNTKALMPIISKTLKKAKERARKYGRQDRSFIANVATIVRQIGNLKFVEEQLLDDYESVYTVWKKAPELPLGPIFVGKAFAASHFTSNHLPCELTTQIATIPAASVKFFGQELKLAGKIYILYSPAKNPVTDQELVRLKIVLALAMPNLKKVHREIIRNNLPSSSCRRKYADAAQYSQTASQSLLLGSSKVKYEKWICEKHFWICFKGWIPRKCTNQIKTKIFTTYEAINFHVSSFVTRRYDENEHEVAELSLNGISNYGFSAKEKFLISSVMGNNKIWEILSDTTNAKWLGSGFSNEDTNAGRPLLILRGESKLLRPNSACGIHKTIGQMIQ